MKATNNKSHSRIFKNALFLYALTFSNYLIGLLLLPYLSRVLSVEKFGVIGFATSFCLVFQMVVEYGFQLSTTATISVHRNDKAKMSRTISTMTYTKLLLACGASAVFLACAMFVDMLRGHFVIILLFFVDSIAKALLPDAYFRGIERMKDITIRAVSAKSGILVATLLFVRGDDTLIIYPVSMIVFDIIALLWAFSLLKRDGLKATGTTMREMLEALKDSFWFFISRISVSINGSLGSIFLGMRYSPESVEMGLYSGATKLSSAGEQMIPPLGDALYPSMVNKKDYRLFYRIVLRGGILWFLACGLVEVLATPLCVLILGGQYASAGEFLRILMVGVFFGYFSFMFGYPALSPIGKATWANAAIMVSAIVNLTACAVLWLTGNITPLTVCVVFSSTNITTFIVRFGAFRKFRNLAEQDVK
ncbi:oligosaccharide flippase family protein [uncultured Bifidobacterium sp.]|uniref:oligosaccharide flippase family protein n=1 Tax=uncultured Bifidobacterium sp. TaxID=165187 RepID=UPI0026727F69|nr:oligosaccharide flippase family protein [uncultured Bifidobacterium sp.]